MVICWSFYLYVLPYYDLSVYLYYDLSVYLYYALYVYLFYDLVRGRRSRAR